MKFHPGKCVVLTVSSKKNPVQADYKLHGHTLARVKSAKYLGVTIIDDLKWDSHINKNHKMSSFKSNGNIHKKGDGSYYVVSANKASSVTL